MTKWRPKFDVSSRGLVDHLYQFASKPLHPFSRNRVHKSSNKRMDGQKDGHGQEDNYVSGESRLHGVVEAYKCHGLMSVVDAKILRVCVECKSMCTNYTPAACSCCCCCCCCCCTHANRFQSPASDSRVFVHRVVVHDGRLKQTSSKCASANRQVATTSYVCVPGSK